MEAWLPPLTALELLDVSENALSSTIPPLSNITRLRSFSVGLNQLSGTLPSDWLNSMFIREFDAASNRCDPEDRRERPAPAQPAVTACQRLEMMISTSMTCRLTGTIPDVGRPLPGFSLSKFPYLGSGGDLYFDFCTRLAVALLFR